MRWRCPECKAEWTGTLMESRCLCGEQGLVVDPWAEPIVDNPWWEDWA